MVVLGWSQCGTDCAWSGFMATVGDIFRAAFPAYAATHRLRRAARWAGGAISVCRTAVLGGHAERCPDDHYIRSHYNSCKHRACPQCGGLETERWLRKQMARYALSCSYRHVVFTVPRELIPVWRYNRSLFSNLMFQSAKEVLLKLLGDARYLGALPGIVGTLHTWGRSGIEHLHLHFLVTLGGWTEAGWRALTGKYFVPYDVLRESFRDRLVVLLRRALERRELVIPGDTDAATLDEELERLGTIDWHVRAMDPYEGGEGVLKYFSRYVRGGPIRNVQIEGFDGQQVTYRYYHHETGECGTEELAVEEFIRRILEHVPEKGFRTVRYYGLFSQSRRRDLTACREALGMAPYRAPKKLTVAGFLALFNVRVVTECPVCHKLLVREELAPVRVHDPPPVGAGYSRAA